MADSREEWARRRDEEEEEEELDESNYKAQKDAVLFAIDVSQSMLAPPPPSDSKKADRDSATLIALRCAYQVMQQRIISSPKDMMGILLFGTEQSKFQDQEANSRSGLTYPHCYLLTNLDVPAAEDVKALKSMVEDEESSAELLKPTDDPVNMANVLFCANQIFTTKAPNFGSRRLFIITDRDDPHASDKAAKSSAAVRAKDLYDLGVIIELFPISTPEREFDHSKFYDDIIYNDPTDPEAALISSSSLKMSNGKDGISLLTALVSNINSKQAAKRALFSNLPFEIGPGFKISVKGYNILQRQIPARSCYVYTGGEKSQIAVGETTKMTDDAAARDVQKAEIKKAYKFGGEQILFSVEEQAQLKDYGLPGLRIVGFKPQSMLPEWASIAKSTFIYPSEEDYVGSTRVFAALWQKLLEDKKMGIAWYIARRNAKPEIVALLPSPETLDPTTGQQSVPAGLWIYPLPFADDLRFPPETATPVVGPDKLVDAMRVVVQQLQLPGAKYEASKYPNPSLQWHYRILQAMALEEDVPIFKDSDDKTTPKYRQIDKRAGSYVVEWGEILEEQTNAYIRRSGGAGVKREADGDGGSRKPKVPFGASKDNKGLLGLNKADLKKAVMSGQLGKANVGDLKAWLTAQGQAITGLKADLVARVEETIEGM